MKPLSLLILVSVLSLSSCAVVSVPLKVAGKVATSSVGVVGKAAEKGIDSIGSDESSE